MRQASTAIAVYHDLQPKEEWRDVVGYEGYYQVSNIGRVRRLQTRSNTRAGKVLRVRRGDFYPSVSLSRPGVPVVPMTVHSMVCRAFLGERPEGYHTNHKDGNKQNNAVANLEYVTAGDNARHAVATGLNNVIGEGNAAAKLTEAQVLDIRRRYRPFTCTMPMLAREFGVSKTQVCAALRGKSWKHLSASSEKTGTIAAWALEILQQHGPLRGPAILRALQERGYRPRNERVNPVAVIQTILARLVKHGQIRRITRGLFEVVR